FHRGKVNQCLWRAVQGGYAEIVGLLMKASPDEDIVSEALRWACLHGCNEIATLLLHGGAAKDFQQFLNDKVIWSTVRDGHAPVLRALLVARADKDKVRNRYTLLGWASRRGHVESVRVLLEAGVQKEKASEGHTPLGWASFEGHAEVVKLLLE
ncbi:Ankrd17, partial [Symbiodinium pilosum]